MTRTEHLEAAKERAMSLCDEGWIAIAFDAFLTDLWAHEETMDHPRIGKFVRLFGNDSFKTSEELKNFIAGFE